MDSESGKKRRTRMIKQVIHHLNSSKLTDKKASDSITIVLLEVAHENMMEALQLTIDYSLINMVFLILRILHKKYWWDWSENGMGLESHLNSFLNVWKSFQVNYINLVVMKIIINLNCVFASH